MAKSKRIASYGERLIKIALNCGEERTIELPSPTNAAAMRFEFYGLRRAIVAEGAEELYADFMRAKIRVEGSTLRISPPEAFNPEWEAAIDRALAGIKTPVIEPTGPAESVWTPPPPKVDPYEAYMKAPDPQPAPPVDPFDLTETRNKIDSFTSAVNAWLAGGEEGK